VSGDDASPGVSTPTEAGERVELERRLVHVAGAVVPMPYVLGWLSWTTTTRLLLASAVAVMILEVLRLSTGLWQVFFDRLTRAYEQDSVAGYVLYMVAIAGVASVASPPAATAGIWALTIGDPVSGVLGENGPHDWKGPVPLGAMFLVTAALAGLVTSGTNTAPVAAVAALVGASLGVIADGAPPVIRGVTVDDNLTIPVAVALGVEVVIQMAG
jgi:Dolichol kinase